MRSTIWTRALLVIMMTVMMTVVSVAYWRWNSRVTEKNVSFRSEVFTLARQPELKEEDIPVLHQLNEEYSRVARLVERVLVSIDTTGVTSVPQPSEDGDFMVWVPASLLLKKGILLPPTMSFRTSMRCALR